MFTSYLKIAFRNLVRNRSFTVLNLLSLIIGLFVAYVAISYIRFELGYDSFHRNASSIYRLARTYRSQDYSIIGFARWDARTDKEQQLQLESLKKATGVANSAQFITSQVPVFIEAEGRKIQERNVLTTNTPQAFCALFTWTLRQDSFQNFAYHITVQQVPFAVIGFFAFILTALIVGIIAYKASLVNPVKSLRSE